MREILARAKDFRLIAAGFPIRGPPTYFCSGVRVLHCHGQKDAMEDQKFRGEVALVTGGGSGIGWAACKAFARAGARVVVSDVNEADGARVVRRLTDCGREAIFIRADVSNAADVKHLIDATVSSYGGLDMAFNNAGVEGPRATVADYPDEAWDQVIAVNLTGVRLCMKYEIQQMLKQHGGAIVNNASILGIVGFANASAYTAAKHGVLGLTKAAALEYASSGIRINAVCPGFIDTPMLQRAGLTTELATREAIEHLHPLGRLGRPEEVAAAAVWLCTPDASFIAGHPLLVDGGYVIQ
jgi:NAD(P)-dependent dehydrogenase (short-subunit alcohol dehydrogenase family)